MTGKVRCISRDARRAAAGAIAAEKGHRTLVAGCRRGIASFACMMFLLFFASVSSQAQQVQLKGANTTPLEGPAAGSDTVLVYGSGLSGSSSASVTVSTDQSWITMLTGSSSMSVKNGPNRVQFQFAANTGALREGHIVLQNALTITVTQAAAGSVPAGPVPIVTSVRGPEAIDVDPQGNVYFTESSGENLYEWTPANQQLTTLVSGRNRGTFLDVALDGAGDLFTLEATPDGNLGSQVEVVPFGALSLSTPFGYSTRAFYSEAVDYLFPAGLCVDQYGLNLNIVSYGSSTKCLIDQFGTVYELDSTDDNENLGSFASAPTNATLTKPPVGTTFFPNGTDYVDPCNQPLPGVSGSLYGLAKDGSGFIYFVDKNGSRVNRYDPTAKWSTCMLSVNGTPYVGPSFGSFTTLANLTYPSYNIAADTTGNVYLSDMPFSEVDEMPRAYLSTGGPFNEPLGGGTGTIIILPATQSLSGVFAPVSSDTSWLTVTRAANGNVTFSCAPNNGPARTGTITVLGVTIPITQASSPVPAAMLMVAGNNQTGAVNGLPFATNLLVKVVNSFGETLPNVTVNFTSPTQNIPVVTDQSGYAATTAMSAYAVGASNVTASITGFSISQVFQLTGVTSGVSVVSGSNQQRQLNTYFQSMVAQVLGPDGKPVVGVPVTFTAPSSGASGTFTASNSTTTTVYTASDGTATAGAFQANGTYGAFAVTASISGVTGVTTSTATFNLTNFSQVQALVGDQTAIVNNAFASPLGVKVSDGNGNPIGGIAVLFEIFSHSNISGGAFFPDGSQTETLLTGSDGIIHSQSMTASAFPGSYNVDAVVTFADGSKQVANWTLTNVASAIVSGALQNGVTTRTLAQPLIVQASPNATAGTMVFTVVPGSNGSGGTFNGQSSVTVPLDSQGYGISPLLKLNGSLGTFTVTAYDGVQTLQGTVTAAPCSNNTTVTTNSDYNPKTTSSTIYGSLRYVLANACSGATIDLTQLGTGNTLTLTGGSMRIDDDMTIAGPVANGNTPLAINAQGRSRIFFVGNGSVTISNLILENGLAQGGASVFGGGGAGMGGAIFIEGGNVTLTNVQIAGSSAIGGGTGVASQCTTNCLYGGGGFAGTAGNGVSPGTGGTSGDLFGLAGLTEGANGDIGGGGGAAEIFVVGQPLPNPNGGNGGFGAGGGAGWYNAGATTSGNGGFGGGGGGGYNGGTGPSNAVVQLLAGTGGYGGGSGYEPAFNAGLAPYPNFGGTGAGFGGGIFLYSGQLTLNSVDFYGNHAVAGTLTGLSGQPTVTGQAKGGALFIYDGAQVINNSSTFGLGGASPDYAADAGLPGKGNSLAPYTNGALCPGQDTADVCGLLGSGTAVSITVPAGMTFTVNGVTYTGSQTLNLSQGQYTLAAPGPQATGAGSQTAFASWSDGGAPSHSITVGSSALSITGTFVTQYLLTTSAGSGGVAFPVTGFVNANTVVNLNAAPNVGSAFVNWTGPVAAAGSANTTVTMTGPQTVTANFTRTQPVYITVQQNVSFTLNGVSYTGPQYLSLPPGQYTLATTSPQVTASGSQQVTFSSWSDGGVLSHSVTVGTSGLSITGNFSTQYLLTASAGSGGAVSNVGGFYDSGSTVNLTATPNPGYVFHNWSGPVVLPSSATSTVTMSQAETVTANFWPAPSACVAAPANITAWWKGDTSATDETTLNNGTLGGDASFATGLVGPAFRFDGTQSPYVTLPAGAFPAEPSNAPFSFETWFQTSGGNGGVILGEQSGTVYGTNLQGYTPAVYVGTDGDLHVEMFYNGTFNQAVSSVPVNDNAWHHVAVTFDGNSEIAYLDGTNIGQSVSYTQAANGPSLSYQLGTAYTYTWPSTNGGWYTFNGLIDEPTMYSRALSATEVLSIAQANSYGKCDPVASVNSSTVTFASLAPGQTATQTAILSNPGNAPLTISSIAADTGDLNFSLLSGNAGDCTAGASVQPGNSCNVRVQFAPQGPGAVSGTISITDNSVVGQGTQIISLTGSGPLPQIVTFTGPSSAVYGSTFTPVVSTNSGATATVVASGSCQISGSVVTMTAGTSQCQLQASWPATGVFAATTASLSVNAFPLVVTATVSVANKVYDGTTVATVSSCTLSNLLPADAGNVTCGASGAAFATSGVGNNIPVTVNGLALSGSAAANYQLSSTTAATTANIAFVSTPSSACIAPPAGVTAWWKGDGDATDVTGAYNGYLNGNIGFPSGLVGQAFSFDGTLSTNITLPAGAFPPLPNFLNTSNAPFSFETWFQTSGGNGGVILSEESLENGNLNAVEVWTPAIYVGTDGKLYAQMLVNYLRTEKVASTVPVNDNAWHHVAVTYDGTNEVVYLDSQNIGTVNQVEQGWGGSDPSYYLGTGFTKNAPATNGGWYNFDGLIDEATVYSRALSASEVAAIVQANSNGKCKPQAWISPGTLTFASVPLGQTAAQTAVLSNPGSSPLIISSIAADAGDLNFSVLSGNANDCAVGTPVQPSASCNVRVQFAPQGNGAASGTISVTDYSLAGHGTQIISLTGSGPLLTPAVTFTAPSFAVYGSTFTPVISTNSGATATIVPSGACQINGVVVTMTAGTSQCHLQASWPANGSYAAATASLSVNATPLVVTATVSAANKAFDGTTVATLSGCTLSNLLPADVGNVSCSASSAAFATSGVGNNIPVTVNGLALSGPAAANYQLSSTTAATTANIAFGSADSACIAPPAGVTAWWKGDGDATDVTGAYNGVLGGDVSFAPGKVGQAFSFDGTQSPYVTLPAGALPAEPSNAPFSFETWFQTSGGNGGVILGEQSGTPYGTNLQGYTPAVYVGTDGDLHVEMFYNGTFNQVVSAIPVNDNAWHHVAVTYDGSNEVVYLDAGAIGTINQLVQGPNGPSLSYQLGTGNTYTWPAGNGGWYTFNGLIDETAIYSRALSSGEVASIVQAESYGKCNPEASISPATLTFSALPSGQSAALTAVLSNPGNAPLTISSIAPDTGDINFSVLSGNANDCAVGTPVQPSASCNVRVQFAPQLTGPVAGSVTVSENSLSNAGTQTIQLAGTSLGPQTIIFPTVAAQTVGTSLTLVATASSGLTVSFISTTPSVCSVSGNIATFLTYGNCTVTATQAGTGNYAAASPVSQTFAVIAPQTIPFFAQSVPVGQTGAAQTAALTFTTAGTLQNINVLTAGVANLDFQLAPTQGSASTDCVPNQPYNAPFTCTVQYTFTPAYAGLRSGAITLTDSSGTLLASTFVGGIGTGPQVVFPSNTATASLGSGFSDPYGVAVDSAGNVYVADTNNNAVKKIPYSGGGYRPPVTVGSGFINPVAVAVDGAGNVYVAGQSHNGVQKIPYSGGSYGTPVTLGSGFNQLQGVAVDGAGNIYVADYGNSAVQEIPYSGGSYGSPVTLGSGFNLPTGIAVDSAGNVYVADFGNNAVKEILYSGGGYGTPVTLGSGFNDPFGVAVDSAGNIYVADSGNNVVKQIPYSGGSYGTSVTLGSGFSYPAAVAVDGAGNVYVADELNSAIKKIALANPPTLSFPSPTQAGTTDTTDGPLAATVQNIGNAPLTFFSPTPGISTGFSLGTESTSCVQLANMTLAAGSSCTLTTTFAPLSSQSGTVSGSISLTDNNLNQANAQQSIPLDGTAVNVPTAVTHFDGYVGSVNLGSTTNFFIYISNPSATSPLSSVTATVTLPSGLSFAGGSGGTCGTTAASGSTVTLSGISLAAGGSCQSGIYLTATQLGRQSVSTLPAAGGVNGTATSVQVNVLALPVPTVTGISPAGGPVSGGTGVTIAGTNFAGTTTVKFGTVAATNLSVSADGTQITATVPAGNPGTVDVTVTTGNGTSAASSADQFTYYAPSYVVTTLIDPASGNGTPGNCIATGVSGDNSKCSLRDAVAAANALRGVTTNISFSPALSANATTSKPSILQIAQPTPITLTQSMNITGPGANLLTVAGGIAAYNGTTQTKNVQMFQMTGGTSTLSAMTLARGYAGTGGGGAIYQTGGALTVSNTAFYGDSAAAQGGAIFATQATLTIKSSTFYNSTASSGGAIASAGGATLTVSNSTFSGNQATGPSGGGGAIYTAQPLTVTGSTFASNQAQSGGSGGAIFATQPVTVTNSIFSGDTAQAGSGIFAAGGGTITNSVLDSSVSTDTFTGVSPAASVTAPASLSSLGLWGGPTQTLLPLPGSAATCAGTLAAAQAVGLTGDERGFVFNPSCPAGSVDAGAVQTNYAAASSLSLAASSIAFGAQAQGLSTSSQNVTITNNGGTPVTINSFGLTGSNASSYAASNTCGSSVAPGATCRVGVRFIPATQGPLPAAVAIVSSGSVSPQVLSLTGTGTTTQTTVSLSSPTAAFGMQTVALSSASQNITVTNTGSATLSFSGITLAGANASSFVTSNTCGAALAPGATCRIGVRFVPTTSGPLSATITLSGNIANPPQTITLTGTGISTSGASVSFSSNTLDFGTQTVGQSTASQNVTVTNTSGVVLYFSGITLSGANASSFVTSNTCGAALAPSATCRIGVRFVPTTSGPLTATITLAGNIANPPQTITLTGTGISTSGASVSFSASSLDFGTQIVGQSTASQNVTVTNTSGVVLYFSGITLSGANASSFVTSNTCGAALAPSATCRIGVRFVPTTSGPLTATITLAGNIANPPQTITLTGTGISTSGASVSFSSSSLDFGTQTVGQSTASQNVTVTNTSGVVLYFSSIRVSGANSSSYVTSNTCGSSVAPGTSCRIGVRFVPAMAGPLPASIVLTDNAGDSAQTIALTGTGR